MKVNDNIQLGPNFEIEIYKYQGDWWHWLGWKYDQFQTHWGANCKNLFICLINTQLRISSNILLICKDWLYFEDMRLSVVHKFVHIPIHYKLI